LRKVAIAKERVGERKELKEVPCPAS
jgi:hypothetical protein